VLAAWCYEISSHRRCISRKTAFTYRFVPAMRCLKHLLGQGAIGLPCHVRIARLMDLSETDLGWRQQRALAGAGESLKTLLAN